MQCNKFCGGGEAQGIMTQSSLGEEAYLGRVSGGVNASAKC